MRIISAIHEFFPDFGDHPEISISKFDFKNYFGLNILRRMLRMAQWLSFRSAIAETPALIILTTLFLLWKEMIKNLSGLISHRNEMASVFGKESWKLFVPFFLFLIHLM